jgi:hypothetical protein
MLGATFALINSLSYFKNNVIYKYIGDIILFNNIISNCEPIIEIEEG